jgi:hypothetical protein
MSFMKQKLHPDTNLSGEVGNKHKVGNTVVSLEISYTFPKGMSRIPKVYLSMSFGLGKHLLEVQHLV